MMTNWRTMMTKPGENADRQAKSGFTLIELLVTVGIIAILAGILLPVVRTVFVTAERRKALVQVTEISKAIEVYHSHYHRPPVAFSEIKGSSGDTSETQGKTRSVSVVKALGAYDTDVNPRRELYFEIPQNEECKPAPKAAMGDFFDPWCEQYGIMLDMDGDRKITFRGKPYTTRSIVFSYGPDGVAGTDDDWGDDIVSISNR
jgi:prepilin-type N-terminal cleavage/methylation domain-containing protein